MRSRLLPLPLLDDGPGTFFPARFPFSILVSHGRRFTPRREELHRREGPGLPGLRDEAGPDRRRRAARGRGAEGLLRRPPAGGVLRLLRARTRLRGHDGARRRRRARHTATGAVRYHPAGHEHAGEMASAEISTVALAREPGPRTAKARRRPRRN